MTYRVAISTGQRELFVGPLSTYEDANELAYDVLEVGEVTSVRVESRDDVELADAPWGSVWAVGRPIGVDAVKARARDAVCTLIRELPLPVVLTDAEVLDVLDGIADEVASARRIYAAVATGTLQERTS